MAARTTASRHAGEAKVVVNLFRVLTDQQFDFWLDALNRASASMGGPRETFKRGDQQKTISYWYLLMYLLEKYADNHNPFEVKKGETWLSDGLLSMEALADDFDPRYMKQTVRRYVFDLKKCGLVGLSGRGPQAAVQISAPAILALADTIRQWVTTFRDVDRRIQKLGKF